MYMPTRSRGSRHGKPGLLRRPQEVRLEGGAVRLDLQTPASGPAVAVVHAVSAARPRIDGRHPDWQTPLDTVTATLRGMTRAGGDAGVSPAEISNGNGHVVAEPDSVRKCIDALEVLQTTLYREFSRYQEVEEEIAAAQAALADAQAAAEQARLDSLHDELTGLPNRTYFLQQLDQALARVGPQQPDLAVMFIDLDGFKLVNDTHGHLVGDALLRIIATRLVRAVRAEDTMSRLGGDEFACLVAGSNRDDLTHLAEKLYHATSQPVTVGTLTLSVHPSIGIACCPGGDASPEALLRCADEAMYYAKKHRLGFALHGFEVVTQVSFRPEVTPGP